MSGHKYPRLDDIQGFESLTKQLIFSEYGHSNGRLESQQVFFSINGKVYKRVAIQKLGLFPTYYNLVRYNGSLFII